MRFIYCLAFLTLPAVAAAQKQDQVDKAIDQGAEWLLKSNNKSPLVLLTLIHSKADPGKFGAWISHAMTVRLRTTYDTALIAMSIYELWRTETDTQRRDEYFERLVECAQFLVDNQTSNGQWRYGAPVPNEKIEDPERPDVETSGGAKKQSTIVEEPSKKKKGKGGTDFKIRIRKRAYGTDGDNSNSQYAALGLRACHDAGIEIPEEVTDLALHWWELCHQKDGGFGYGGCGVTNEASYGSMTAGALGSYAIWKYIKNPKTKDLSKDPALAKASKWIERNFSVRDNPHGKGELSRFHYYYLYALERAGMLLGIEKFGEKEWYALGALYLLQKQKTDGSWIGAGGVDWQDTCFAILFLRRGTRPLDVATGGGR